MKKTPPSSHRRLGLIRRTVLLAWLVTLVPLTIFAFAMVAGHKRTMEENLKSKALAVSLSLQGASAGAIVTGDYSSVVDHCKQVLQGDRSITFLVLTRHDGFSLILETGVTTNTTAGIAPWQGPLLRAETLSEYWHPPQRAARNGIERVPVLDERVFHYAQPLDYSGIQWGWMHIGLSLDSYDQSIWRIYRGIGLVAVVSLLFSLGASLFYPRRLGQTPGDPRVSDAGVPDPATLI